jgi:transposase-like protein
MLTNNAPELLEGIVEVDETYVGGKESNKHASKRTVKAGVGGKTMVFGAVERSGRVKTKVIPETNTKNILEAIDESVEKGSIMVSDEHRAYAQLHLKYDHKQVNHREKEYVRKEAELKIHTNNIEGFWNILKKQINGIHHSVSPKHLQRYCHEASFRYNRRKVTQDERFANALANCNGSLTWKSLTAKQC